jgi:hypothetical protein
VKNNAALMTGASCRHTGAPQRQEKVQMIDFAKVAEDIHYKALKQVERTRIGDDPSLSTEDKLRRLTEADPLPPEGELAQVLEEVFWASLSSEEHRPCRPVLCYGLSRGNADAHWFARRLPLTRAQLRRLAPTLGDHSLLIWETEAGEQWITGIGPRFCARRVCCRGLERRPA